MLDLAWRNVRENPTRYALTAMAITLGVAFYVATTVLTATVDDSISGGVDTLYEDIDAGVRSTVVADGRFIDVRGPVDPSVVAQVAEIDGVEAVAPSMSGYAQLVGADGKAVGDAADIVIWSESDALNRYVVSEGRAPENETEIVVNTTALDDGGLRVGDTVRMLPQTDAGFTIVGALTLADGDSLEGLTAVGMTFEGAADILDTTDIDTIYVAGDGSDPDLAATIDAQLGQDLQAVSGQTLADEFKERLNTFVSIISIFLTTFAGIAVFVSIFVIYNTFSITVSQRQKEMAMLRAIGATPRQVLRSVLVESIAIGIVASVLGVVLGVVLGWILLQLLASFGFSLGATTLTIVPTNLLIGFAVGLIVTMVAAYVPARRASRIPPIEALRDTAIETVAASTIRNRVGLALLALGAVLSAIGAANLNYWIGGLGMSALLAGIVAAAPVVTPKLASILGKPLRQTRGVVGEVAAENSTRNPKRTATTALALTIGVTLVVTASVVASSMKDSIPGDLEDSLRAELIVEAGAGRTGGLSTGATEELLALSSVEFGSPVRPITGTIDGTAVSHNAVSADELDALVDLEILEGDLSKLADGGIAVSEGSSNTAWSLGDTIALDLLTSTEVDLTVVAIYDNDSVVGNMIVDTSVSDQVTAQLLDPFVLVKTDDPATATTEMQAVLAGDPTAEVITADQYIDDQAGSLNTLLNILYGLLGLSVIIALLGVTNTMSLSVYERTRELGLMRAVGMTGPQLRSSVRYESSLVALVGSLAGLVLGVFFGWLAYLLVRDTFPVFAIPWSTLVIIAGVGVIAGIIAGWRPAVRASKLNVLDAISH